MSWPTEADGRDNRVDDQRERVSAAFGKQAPHFDALDDENPLIGWMRARVRLEAMRAMQPCQSLLELNAGTGIDSLFFAEQGLRVTATDDSPGMLDQLHAKLLGRAGLDVEVLRCSFLDLASLGGRRFDHVFSNFGGLDCTDRLDVVLTGADALLRPGGTMTLVLMPPVAPWELAEALRGHLALASRRLRRGGSVAHVEGVAFRCWYYTCTDVARILPAYRVQVRRALGFMAPPPHHQAFAARHPSLVRSLQKLDDRIAGWPGVRNAGDHILLVIQKPGADGGADGPSDVGYQP